MFRLFALCIFLSVLYSEVSADEFDRNGSVPSTKKSQKGSNSQEEFKDNTKTISQIGTITSTAGDLTKSSRMNYIGRSVKATASGINAANSTLNCLENTNADNCSDSAKDISNTLKSASDNLKTYGSKSNILIKKFNDVVNTGSPAVKAISALNRGDQEKVIDHTFETLDAGANVVLPLKPAADVVCERGTGKSCLRASSEMYAKTINDLYERTGCVPMPDGAYCDEMKQDEIINKAAEERRNQRLANFNNVLIENEKYQAKIRHEAQDNQKQSSPNNDDGAVFFDFVGVVLNGVIDNEVKKAESKNSRPVAKNTEPSSTSISMPTEYYSPKSNTSTSSPIQTIDLSKIDRESTISSVTGKSNGCHPGHDEKAHPGGCHDYSGANR